MQLGRPHSTHTSVQWLGRAAGATPSAPGLRRHLYSGGMVQLQQQRGTGPAHASSAGGGPHPLINDVGHPVLSGPRLVLSQNERRTLDTRPASEFYATPRIGVAHADDAFLQALTGIYSEVLASSAEQRLSAAAGPSNAGSSPSAVNGARISSSSDSSSSSSGVAGGAANGGGVGSTTLRVLDLCSSWASYLPALGAIPGVAGLHVTGHGLNTAELAANAALEERIVQDLDVSPRLPLPTGSFDAALCANGVYYLTRLEEVSRLLVPGGSFVIAFGESCFRDRALSGFLGRSLDERTELISRVLLANGFASVRLATSPAAPDLRAIIATTPVATAPTLAPPPGPALRSAPAISAPLPGTVAPAPPGDSGSGGAPRDAQVALEWRAAYAALCDDARELGIPASAIPQLPEDDGALTLQLLQERQAHLQAMVESFLSSGL